MPLISVIVPVYNVAVYLNECIESLLNQTLEDFELILVDDGSTDGSSAICDDFERLDKRVKVYHGVNNGLSAARNRGLKEARGNYLAFVDSDDYVAKTYLQQLYMAIKINKADVSMCGFYGVFKEGLTNDSESRISEMKYRKNEFLEKVYTFPGFYNPVWNKLYKKEIFNELYFTEGVRNEDSYLIRDIVMKCDLIYTFPEPLYFYRRRKGSLMNSNQEVLLEGELNWLSKDIAILNEYNHKLYILALKLYCNKIIDNYFFLPKTSKKLYQSKMRNSLKTLLKDDKLMLKQKIKFGICYLNISIYNKLNKKLKFKSTDRTYVE